MSKSLADESEILLLLTSIKEVEKKMGLPLDRGRPDTFASYREADIGDFTGLSSDAVSAIRSHMEDVVKSYEKYGSGYRGPSYDIRVLSGDTAEAMTSRYALFCYKKGFLAPEDMNLASDQVYSMTHPDVVKCYEAGYCTKSDILPYFQKTNEEHDKLIIERGAIFDKAGLGKGAQYMWSKEEKTEQKLRALKSSPEYKKNDKKLKELELEEREYRQVLRVATSPDARECYKKGYLTFDEARSLGDRDRIFALTCPDAQKCYAQGRTPDDFKGLDTAASILEAVGLLARNTTEREVWDGRKVEYYFTDKPMVISMYLASTLAGKSDVTNDEAAKIKQNIASVVGGDKDLSAKVSERIFDQALTELNANRTYKELFNHIMIKVRDVFGLDKDARGAVAGIKDIMQVMEYREQVRKSNAPVPRVATPKSSEMER